MKRSVLLRLIALVFLCTQAALAIEGDTFVYVSLDSLQRIAVYKMDPAAGGLTFVSSHDAHGQPGSLAVDPAHTRLYAAIRSTNSVSSFRINAATGALTLMDSVTVGWNPASVAVDASGRFLFTAHFSDDRAAVYRIRPDGAVQAGVVQVITTPMNPHSVHTDRSNRFLFVPCRSGEAILEYRFDAGTGSLTPNVPDRSTTPDSTGPRLLAFHPRLNVVYAVNEFARSVTAYSIDSARGTLAPLQTLSLQSRTPTAIVIAPNIGGADIHTTPDGRFLYASNRGPNTIAAYRLDPSTGLMTAIGEYATEAIPRSFAIDPSGHYLYAGGQRSGAIAAYRIDTMRGTLTPLRVYHVGSNPACVTIVQTPAGLTYQNPIIPGFNPDPSICRVGADYYLVTSTFEYFPGVPVYHSRDLVHWTMIGHVLDRPSQLDLDSVACSGGIYAPTIQYNKGTFYMITTLVGQTKSPQHRNFIVTAKNPAGPWSDPHWIADAPGIDPSLFFDDDGKVYYSGNDSPKLKLWDKHRNIWLQELDVTSWKLVGKRVDVLDGAEYYKKGTLDGGIETGVNNYEASHLYKKDGTYYLLIAHGGTSQNHAVSIWRSRNVFGPYDMNPSNPILTHRELSREHVFTSTGHADLVQTQHGDWWMVYLAKRPYGGENHILGRETFISPVEWSGVWPVVNPKGAIGHGELTHPVPSLQPGSVTAEHPKDEFAAPSLHASWTFIRTPRSQWWSLTRKKGWLRIDVRPEVISEQSNPSFIGRRQEHKNFSAAVKMEFTPRSEMEEAGVVVERDKEYYFTFTIGVDGGKNVVRLSRKGGPETRDSLLAKAPVRGRTHFLRISSEGTRYSFSFSGNGRDWTMLKEHVDGSFLGLAGAGRFTGTFIGMYASSHRTTSTNHADFDWFSYEAAHDPVTLPRFMSDGMVLQRGMPIPIWGWAQPGETVHVAFRGANYAAVAGADRKWSLSLKPATAGGPHEMTISGGSTITLHNILIGDVWLCSGQSNMEFELSKAQERYPNEIAASANDKIRQFLVKRRVGFTSVTDVESDEGWQAANPQSVLKFTAAGYFFAKELYAKYHVPIGLINCTYGGTPAEAWMSDDAVNEYPAYYAKAMEFKDTATVNRITQNDNRAIEKWYSGVNSSDSGSAQRWCSPSTDVSGWSRMQVPNFWQEQGVKDVDAGVVWFHKEIDVPAALAGKPAVLRLGNIIMRDSTFVNGTYVGSATNKYTPRKYTVAGPLLRAGINVITVRVLNESGEGGFIKDKPYSLHIGDTSIDLSGEWRYKLAVNATPLLRDDVTRFQVQPTAMYHGMLSPLIGWGIKGVIWYQGESNVSRAKEYRTLFPAIITSWRSEWRQGDFPFLFVQLANINKTKAEPGESKLAELQEAQTLALSLTNTGMAVANDIGEWNDVHPLNKAEVGRRLFLAAQQVAYGEQHVVSSGPQYKSMTIDGGRIILTFTHVGGGLVAKGGGEVKYFSIAGADKKFVWAHAAITGDKIVVWNDAVTAPVAVRYAWADNPAGANLSNKEGLPASCFRTDNHDELMKTDDVRHADSVAFENGYVRVLRNSSGAGKADVGTRVIVALTRTTVHGSTGEQALERGGVAVFRENDQFTVSSGDFFNVGFKKHHPPLTKPEEWIEPEKNTIVYEDDAIRIFEERLPAGGERALHSHMQRVVVRLNEVQLTDPRMFPNGTPGAGIQVPNTVKFAEPMVHVVRNLSSIPLFNIVLEYKLPHMK